MIPVFLTREHVAKHYKLTKEKAAEVTADLPEIGFYLRRTEPLFSKYDVEKVIKNG